MQSIILSTLDFNFYRFFNDKMLKTIIILFSYIPYVLLKFLKDSGIFFEYSDFYLTIYFIRTSLTIICVSDYLEALFLLAEFI
jgi:hypothetical protein